MVGNSPGTRIVLASMEPRPHKLPHTSAAYKYLCIWIVPICFLKWHKHRRNLPVVVFVLHQVILKTETSQLVFKNIKFGGVRCNSIHRTVPKDPVNTG